jgi:hypothetical protein
MEVDEDQIVEQEEEDDKGRKEDMEGEARPTMHP